VIDVAYDRVKMRGQMRRRRAAIRQRARERGDVLYLDRFADSAVYFISDDFGHIKIGIAIDVEDRRTAMQIGNAGVLRIEAVIPGGGPQLEAELHSRFASARLRGEWFTFTADIALYIDTLRSAA
jgi:hypothetical protein